MKRRKTTNRKKKTNAKPNLANDVDAILAELDRESQNLNVEIQSEDDLPHPSLVCVQANELSELGIDIEISSEPSEANEPVINIDLPCAETSSIQSSTPNEILHQNTSEQQEVYVDDTSDIEEILEPPAKVRKLNKNGSGRKLSPSWDEFISTSEGSKVQCKHCKESISKKIERLRGHLLKCKKYKKQTSVSRRESVPDEGPVVVAVGKSGSNKQTNKKTPRVTLEAYVDKVSKQEQTDLNMEIGRYVYSMNLPFSHVEHPAFKRLFSQVKPACVLPKRFAIGGSILNATYDKIRTDQLKELAGKPVVVMQDGWKTKTSEPVIAHSINVNGKSMFWNAIGTKDEKKTSKYCAKLLMDTIREIEIHGCYVIAVVTDNCNSMNKMRRIIEVEYPGIYTFGCHAHLLNLVGKQTTDEELMDKVQKVHSYFRNHDIAWAKLKEKNAGRPAMPSGTRWCAWHDTFDYYLKNQTKMLDVTREDSVEVRSELISILGDGCFYAKVQEATLYMKPIQVAIDTVQSHKSSLADGINQWLKLKADLVNLTGENLEYFITQFNRALQPVGIAAYMLHPCYRGRGLDPSTVEVGNSFLSDNCPEAIVIAAQLSLMDEHFFPSEMFMDKILKTFSPVAWWTTLDRLKKIPPGVITFTTKLMKLPASSADIERHFSTLGNIINQRRCKLGIKKASMLCVIYRHFAEQEPPTDDGYGWEDCNE